MKYIEEKDGMLYKYKVDVDYDKLKDLFLEIRKGNFEYSSKLDKGVLDKKDLDFKYVKFDDSTIEEGKDGKIEYKLVYHSLLYKLTAMLLGVAYDFDEEDDEEFFLDDICFSNEYMGALAISGLLKYNGEEDLVSVISKEIKEREEGLDNLYSNNANAKELYKIRELYRQRNVASNLPNLKSLYESVMEAISYEVIGEINKKDYIRYLVFRNCSNDTYLKVEGDMIRKYRVSYDFDRIVDILNDIQRNTRYKDENGSLWSTGLEDVFVRFLYGDDSIERLIKYDNSVDARVFEENAKYNDQLVSTTKYYDEILKELKYNMIASMSVDTFNKASKFSNGINYSDSLTRLILDK